MNARIAITAAAFALSAMQGRAQSATAQSDSAAAKDAEGFFNRASKQYVKEDKSSAMRELDRGLRAHPGDPKLLKLAEALLKEDQQQQQQKQEQQQQQQEQQENQEQRQSQAQEQQEERKSGGMDKRDAERLLDELNREEQDVQERARSQRLSSRRPRPEKDW